ncbi:MAG: exosome non-catalytic core subunit rrp40 [Geoglossum umbratile]|nr:MAG: exosome non-catalytic core subunit rrp40 [Geoglossum umbratile]
MAPLPLVLPGDPIAPGALPTPANPSVPLKVGPGLRYLPPDTIVPVVAGGLCIDHRKNAVWVEGTGGRYIPTVGDLVLATVHHSTSDSFSCSISPHTPFASLPYLAFAGVTRKTRPQFSPGSLVYARVSLANKHMDPEIECVNPATGKSDGLGGLTGGMLFDVSLGMSRRLMMPNPSVQGSVVVLDEIAEKVPFEMAVGRNGRIWVDAEGIAKTLAVGRAIQETDKENLGVDEQRKLAKKLLKGL